MFIKVYKQKTMSLFDLEIRLNNTYFYILLILILTPIYSCKGMPCTSNSWWDPSKNECVECTICDDDMIVLRPCQAHKDTVCGSINDLEFDWSWLARTESRNTNWKERRKNTEDTPTDTLNEEWDWQTASLGLASLTCLLFFIAAGLISLHHVRQLRKIERRFDRDVEQLSARLMAKFIEVQNLENDTIFIEDSGKHLNGNSMECVYLEQLLVGKDSKNISSGPGNLYIEETSSSITNNAFK